MKFQSPSTGRFSAKARNVWDRVTFSRITVLYLVFSLVHFFIQISLQIRAFTINANAGNFLAHILAEGNGETASLPFQHNSSISLCTWLSSDLNTEVESCQVVWSAANDTSAFQQPLLSDANRTTFAALSPSSSPETVPTSVFVTPSATSASITSTSTTTVFVTASPRPTVTGVSQVDSDSDNEGDDDDDGAAPSNIGRITITPFQKREHATSGPDGEPLVLNDTCLLALNWPLSQLRNTKREDIVFVAFQFWVLGMSLVALLNESIPHIIASLLTHLMATAWAAFQITHTANFRANFNRVITNGACKGNVLLSEFWNARSLAEYPSLALHGVALIISCVLTWKLVKLYGWQTFKRVGASRTINSVYKIVLTLSITLQLSFFFMFVTVSLWLDQLFNSVIGDMADHTKLYQASSFVTLVLLIPWLVMGWFAVRREHRLTMLFFLVLSILYLLGWGAMFFSTTFRWTFVTWRFFSVIASSSVFMTCMAFVLGIVCRLNFGKGLLRYLNVQDSPIDNDDRSSIWDEKQDEENVAFPSMESLVPTFTSTYGPEDRSSPNNAPPSYMGPRFFQAGAPPFETSVSPRIASPPPAVTRNLTDVPQVRRSDSNGSEKSITGSFHSRNPDHSRQGSQSSGHSGHSGHSAKRWVIE